MMTVIALHRRWPAHWMRSYGSSLRDEGKNTERTGLHPPSIVYPTIPGRTFFCKEITKKTRRPRRVSIHRYEYLIMISYIDMFSAYFLI